METIKNAVNNLLGRKPSGPKVRYGIIAAGWISQGAFMPGVGQTSNSGRLFLMNSSNAKFSDYFSYDSLGE